MSSAAALLAIVLAAASLLLVIAGLLKLLRPTGTLDALRAAGLPDSPGLVRLLGTAEIGIAAAFLLLGGPIPTLALAAVHAGFAGFSFRLRRRDDTAACGCFGTGAPVSPLHIVDNLVIAVLAAINALGSPPGIDRVLDEAPWPPVISAVAILIVTGIQHRLLTAGRKRPAPPPATGRPAPAHLTGIDASSGDHVTVSLVGVSHDTAIIHLSSTCLTCREVWLALGHRSAARLPKPIRLVIVTNGPEREDRERIRTLAPPDQQTILSTDAARSLDLPGAPWAMLVSGETGRIVSEGTGSDWPSLRAHLMAPARSVR